MTAASTAVLPKALGIPTEIVYLATVGRGHRHQFHRLPQRHLLFRGFARRFGRHSGLWGRVDDDQMFLPALLAAQRSVRGPSILGLQRVGSLGELV